MVPKGSLPRSQQPATCPYPEPARSIPCLHIQIPADPSQYYPTIYAWVFQVVSFPHVSPPKPFIHLSHIRAMSRLSHSSRFYHPNNIGLGVQIIKLLIMLFSQLPRYLVPLRPKYSPQHPILKTPSAYVPPSMLATKFHTHTKQQTKL